jgi:hypothetical protein
MAFMGIYAVPLTSSKIPEGIIRKVCSSRKRTIMKSERWWATFLNILLSTPLTIHQIYELGLKNNKYSIADLLAAQEADSLPMLGAISTSTPIIVWRERADEATLKRFMSEVGPHKQDIIVDPEHGYFVVEPDMSVVFLSKPKSLGRCSVYNLTRLSFNSLNLS